MLACFTDICPVPAIGYLFLLLFSVLTTASTACNNGNCQVPPFFFLFFCSHSLFLALCLSLIQDLLKFTTFLWIWIDTLKNLQFMEACTAATDCGTGLYCGNCPASGKTQPTCTRGTAVVPTTIVSFFLTWFCVMGVLWAKFYKISVCHFYFVWIFIMGFELFSATCWFCRLMGCLSTSTHGW